LFLLSFYPPSKSTSKLLFIWSRLLGFFLYFSTPPHLSLLISSKRRGK
jgi:hypothetical protein